MIATQGREGYGMDVVGGKSLFIWIDFTSNSGKERREADERDRPRT
jgi:hypothetical protein